MTKELQRKIFGKNKTNNGTRINVIAVSATLLLFGLSFLFFVPIDTVNTSNCPMETVRLSLIKGDGGRMDALKQEAYERRTEYERKRMNLEPGDNVARGCWTGLTYNLYII